MSNNTSSLLMDSLELPRFNTIYELAKLTGLSTRLLYCLSIKTQNYYRRTTIPKRNGTAREINIPSYTLRILQRWILVNILNKIRPSTRAMAFRRGPNFGQKQNAYYHSHTLYGLSLDLKDFFPSISANKIYTVFSNIGYDHFASTILTNICTLEGKLPQGGVCSPALSNIVCKALDKRLIGLCEKRGIRFTRYADDMYFSCDDKTLLLKNFSIICKIIEDEGFDLNNKKTHFYTPSNRKRITGITLVTIPTNTENAVELKAAKHLKKKIRAEIFKCIMSGNYKAQEHILGEIAYVSFVEKENPIPYLIRIKKYINDLGGKIEFFPELITRFNENLFFTDSSLLEPHQLEINTEEDFEHFQEIFQERQRFIKKNNIKDICNYSNWPELILKEILYV